MPIDPHLRRLALGCLALGFPARTVPPWLARALGDGLGGVILFADNVGDGRDVGRLTGQIRAAAARDVVIGIDEEGGDVTRLDTGVGSVVPGAAALGALDDVDATEAVYRGIGQRLAAVGITVDLAPVADVNSDPRNPVIGVRSFSADPAVVSRQVAAAVRGLQSAGVAACVKHFPGHGATITDSHLGQAVVEATRPELDQTELRPFRAAIAAGTRAVMTGHLLVPAVDPHRPATVSPAVTTTILRDELGFAGTVVTDALEMRAIADTVGMVDGFVAALAAGADLVETGAGAYPWLVDEIPAAVAEAVDRGQLTYDRVAHAAKNAAELATRPIATPMSPLPDVWARCVQIEGVLPRLHRPMVVECRTPNGIAAGEVPWSFGPQLRAETVTLTDADALAPVVARRTGRSIVLVVRDVHRFGWQREVVTALAPDVIVDVGWPTDDLPLPVVRTRGVAPGLLAAAARILSERSAS